MSRVGWLSTVVDGNARNPIVAANTGLLTFLGFFLACACYGAAKSIVTGIP